MESSPQSKEIRKIAKQLENPLEREKLVKALKVLASAQESEEKRKGGSLVAYITPIIQLGTDTATHIFKSVKNIPVLVNEFVDYLRIEKNREDFWTALAWFPALIVFGAFLEGVLMLVFKNRLERINTSVTGSAYARRQRTYAYMTLFYPFLYSLLFLPYFVSDPSIGKWIVGFWLLLFGFRVILLERKVSRLVGTVDEEHPQDESLNGWPFLRIWIGVAIWALLMSGLNFAFDIKSYGEDFVSNLILFISFPLLILYYRSWRRREMIRYLDDSKSLGTVPKKMAPVMNVFIRYLPVLFLVISIPIVIDKIFFEGTLWQTYGLECAESLIILAVFLEGRRRVDALASYKLPKFQAAKVQAFTSYLSPFMAPISRTLQWGLYLSFFAFLMAIWNDFFSDIVVSIVSHPMTKTATTIGTIWGIIYVVWLGLDFFVQYHTKPQQIKGKKREPTVFAKTFGPMLHSVAKWLMVLVTIFVTLESFGFDLKIFVYLMSAFALAVSLGSQSLVKDIINGFFALVDGSFAVGDVVTIGAHTGAVESLSLRSITLRHNTGYLQTIPFSEVGNIINRSRNYNVVQIDVATSYKTKIGTVHEALSKAEKDMSKDPIFGKMILEALKVTGVDRFAESAVHVSASIKITPDPNNYFAREFNRLLKTHLDALGIAPPIAFQEKWSKV
jgi:small-conductance mechanosensitive channel